MGKGEIARNEQFSFSYIVYYPLGNVPLFSSNLKLSSAHYVAWKRVETSNRCSLANLTCSPSTSLLLLQTTNFNLFRFKALADNNIKLILLKNCIFFIGRKLCEKRRKFLRKAFLSGSFRAHVIKG